MLFPPFWCSPPSSPGFMPAAEIRWWNEKQSVTSNKWCDTERQGYIRKTLKGYILQPRNGINPFRADGNIYSQEEQLRRKKKHVTGLDEDQTCSRSFAASQLGPKLKMPSPKSTAGLKNDCTLFSIMQYECTPDVAGVTCWPLERVFRQYVSRSTLFTLLMPG